MNKLVNIFFDMKSFVHALRGIYSMIMEEQNARIHIVSAILVCSLGVALKVTYLEWAILLICIAAVISAEQFNTAIENVSDVVSPKIHPKIGKAKDMAAGGVLVVAIAAIIIGIIIFFPKIRILLHG